MTYHFQCFFLQGLQDNQIHPIPDCHHGEDSSPHPPHCERRRLPMAAAGWCCGCHHTVLYYGPWKRRKQSQRVRTTFGASVERRKRLSSFDSVRVFGWFVGLCQGRLFVGRALVGVCFVMVPVSVMRPIGVRISWIVCKSRLHGRGPCFP